MSHKLSTLISVYDVGVHDHLDRGEIVPVYSGMQRQGDVLVIPCPQLPAAATPVPRAGVPVVRGENGGHTHLLLPDGDVRCDTQMVSTIDPSLAVVTVQEGATAYLAHPEHGYTGIGPGTYRLNRQREQADELRMVAD